MNSILTIEYHLKEAIKYMNNGDISCFPGFDCGIIELQLALKELKSLKKEVINNETE